MKLPLRDDQVRDESIARDGGERRGDAKKPEPPRWHPQIKTAKVPVFCRRYGQRNSRRSFLESIYQISEFLSEQVLLNAVLIGDPIGAVWLLFSPTMLAGAAFVHAF